MLPKKSALTDYSYRLSHDHQRGFLAALDHKMITAGLASSGEAIFDLDFHAVMHWGADPVLEKHYVPTRSQRARSVLTFFAQDSGTHNLVYASADLSKATQAREVDRVLRPLEDRHRRPTRPCWSWTRRSPPSLSSANSTPAASSSSPCGCAHPPCSRTSTPCTGADFKTITLEPARQAQPAQGARVPGRHRSPATPAPSAS